ncbi:hypothetical protein [Kutzneria sp. CA-103260]|uniref:hypothetical protein n=1 Tax=Kutzneria sp. CA-103260 TaxID=2802641 RepID=UPI001BADF12F|nr:hypothetical protein [Kutzneria sp. CA-103260]QUQ64238.1 hypothetical protein JJ691_19580 [Kutzneria sp. CA-103260]
MTITGLAVDPDGTVTPVAAKRLLVRQAARAATGDSASVQQLVGGTGGVNAVAYVDEEGYARGLVPNDPGSRIAWAWDMIGYGQRLLGAVVFFGWDARCKVALDLPQEFADAVHRVTGAGPRR